MENKSKLTVIYFIIGICLLFFSLNLFGSFFDRRSEQLYKQGLKFYNNADYQNAYFNFKKVSMFSPLSSVAIYRQATCADMLNDNSIALKKYSKFAKIIKDKEIAPAALWKKALINLKMDNKKAAKKIFEKIEDKYPESDFAKASLYQLARLDEVKNKDKAKSYLVDYVKYAPYGRYAKNAVQMLESYSDIKFSDDDKIVLANYYYNNNDYGKSLLYLKELSNKKSWYYLAKNYEKLNMQNEFRANIEKGISYNDVSINENDFLNLISSYVESSKAEPKQNLFSLVYLAKEKNTYPLILFTFSKYTDKSSAIKNYTYIYQNYPNSIVAPDSLWHVFWNFYKIGNYNEALRIAQYKDDVYRDDNILPKIIFWSGKIYNSLGCKRLANQAYQEVLNNYPDSYYAFRSKAEIHRIRNPWIPAKIVEIRKVHLSPAFPLLPNSKTGRLLDKFAQIGDYKAIEDFKIEDEFIKSWLAAKNGQKSYSILLARDEISELEERPEKSSPLYKLLYPIYYEDFINKYAREFDINPYIILALIREESYFDSDAKSSVGALGLSQLMPDTAKMFVPDLQAEKLLDPDFNIYLGAKYFKYLMNEFNDNTALSILAYNSGPNNVKKWLKESKAKSFDEFVEDIPYSETNNYIKRVYASYWNYTRIYR